MLRTLTDQIDPHHPYATCGGPPTCAYCRAILFESAEHAYERVKAEDIARGLRTACAPGVDPPHAKLRMTLTSALVNAIQANRQLRAELTMLRVELREERSR